MKILFVSPFYPPYIRGGAEVSTSIVASEISKHHTVDVLTQKHQKSSWNEDGVTVLPQLNDMITPDPNFLEILKHVCANYFINPIINLFKIKSFLEKNQTDILHITATAHSVIPTVLSAVWAKKPVVMDIRGGALICPCDFSKGDCQKADIKSHKCFATLTQPTGIWPWYFEMFRFIYALFHYLSFVTYRKILLHVAKTYPKIRFVFLSHFLMDQYVRFGFPAEKSQVIYNPMPPSLNTIHLNVKRKENTFVFAGRLEEEKGVWTLLHAFQKSLTKNKELKLFIAGDGTSTSEIEQFIQKNNLTNSVTLLGKVSQEKVLELYGTSTAIIAPSIWPEPFGRFVLDSISLRTPIIASNSGGIPEGIKNRETGILVNPGDVDALSAAILELATNKKLLSAFSKNLELEKEKYSVKKIVQQRLTLYSSLLK
jgi:glycosyltransferase involved in cell wall biosynthesis